METEAYWVNGVRQIILKPERDIDYLAHVKQWIIARYKHLQRLTI